MVTSDDDNSTKDRIVFVVRFVMPRLAMLETWNLLRPGQSTKEDKSVELLFCDEHNFTIVVRILSWVRLFPYDSRKCVSSCFPSLFFEGMDFLWQMELCRRGDKWHQAYQ